MGAGDHDDLWQRENLAGFGTINKNICKPNPQTVGSSESY
jgi:hypothetical protein